MNRNQKIALGCGGAGCLGLIVIAIVGCVLYFLVYRQPAVRRVSREYNFNVNLNSNSSNANSNASAPDVDANSNASSMSDDDKHKLFQAAAITGDTELINRVNVKIGILNEDFTPGQDYDRFIGEHVGWAIRHTDFITSVNTPEKARAYVNSHFPE
jgi:hypothetical protein